MGYQVWMLSDQEPKIIADKLRSDGNWKVTDFPYEQPESNSLHAESNLIAVHLYGGRKKSFNLWNRAKCFVEYALASGDVPSELYKSAYHNNLKPHLGEIRWINLEGICEEPTEMK